jgi:hypothetical protein
MLELSVMAQSVNVMQEAITEVGVVDGSARDEVHVHLIYYCAVRFMFIDLYLVMWWFTFIAVTICVNYTCACIEKRKHVVKTRPLHAELQN